MVFAVTFVLVDILMVKVEVQVCVVLIWVFAAKKVCA